MSGVKATKNALSEQEIKNFYDKHIYPMSKIPFAFKFLKDAINTSDLPEICFIHTDLHPDNINNGYNDHWLLLIYDQFFDSYGYQEHYNLGEFKNQVNFVHLHPSRIQEFGSVVCGEYCLNFAEFYCNYEGEPSKIGEAYCKSNGFSTNTKENDEQVLQWYNQEKTSNS